MNVQNALAAAAAAYAAGAHLHDIRQGLRTFSTSFFEAPGRLNLVELRGVRVIVDYAHNPAGLASVGDFVERLVGGTVDLGMPGNPSWAANLRVGVVASAGDRRDDDLRELGRVAARYFDDVIIREDENPRGRARGEAAALIAEGVEEARAAGARAGHVEIVTDELEAAKRALDRARPGDLVVVCVDHAERIWDEIERRRATRPGISATAAPS
jgi:cyanophycin synthetase